MSQALFIYRYNHKNFEPKAWGNLIIKCTLTCMIEYNYNESSENDIENDFLRVIIY